jgi:hypothetical protein
MTAKEKAEDLFNKFKEFTEDWDVLDGYVVDIYRAKQCALIAVEEVLGYMGADRGTEFWQEVKIEIEKL